MRMAHFVDNYVKHVMMGNDDDIRDFAANIVGGWEGWAQVEIYKALRDSRDAGLASFEREAPYPGGGRADFKFRVRNAPNISMWVELKAQRPRAAIDDLFASDYEKIHNLNLPSASNTIAAIAVAPINRNHSLQSIYAWWEYIKKPRGNAFYYTLAGTTETLKFSGGRPSDIHGAGALIVYYIHI